MRLTRRVLDLVVAGVALFALSPLMVGVAIWILLWAGPPIFFKHRRVGLNEREFILYKFRTMTMERDGRGNLLPDERRLTGLGRLLRRTSLDELPQLWNVLKGDMSLVGPRPLLPEYLPRYNKFQRRRHQVKPGITGWAQVNGRNALSWEKKFELDVWYADHRSLWLDVRILLKTVWLVLTRQGISEPGQATMSEFLGSSQDGPPNKQNGDVAAFARFPQTPW